MVAVSKWSEICRFGSIHYFTGETGIHGVWKCFTADTSGNERIMFLDVWTQTVKKSFQTTWTDRKLWHTTNRKLVKQREDKRCHCSEIRKRRAQFAGQSPAGGGWAPVISYFVPFRLSHSQSEILETSPDSKYEFKQKWINKMWHFEFFLNSEEFARSLVWWSAAGI